MPGIEDLSSVPLDGVVCAAGVAAGVSPPTGAVPGAGWAAGGVCPVPDAVGWVVVGVPVCAGVAGADCAHIPVVSANARPASVNAFELIESDLMT